MWRVVRIAVLVLLGALVTVAVQWAAVLRTGGETYSKVLLKDDPTLSWPVSLSPPWPPQPQDRQSVRKWGASSDGWVSPWIEGTGECRVYSRVVSGWPLRSAIARTRSRHPMEEYTSDGVLLYTSNWPARLKGRRPGLIVLPVRPLWVGFAGNTILYACALGLLLAAPGAVRRRIRRRRGRCLACGYELAGILGSCPECGKEQRAIVA